MKHFTSLLLIISMAFCSINLAKAMPNDTTVIADTLTEYLDRSADMVFHVANNSSAPIYQRYFFGTNENYTEISQHFDYPVPSTDSSFIVKVELLGMSAQVAVNQVMGGTPDTIIYNVYDTDSDGYPIGSPIASSSFVSGGLAGSAIDLPFPTDTRVSNTNGFAISFETFRPGSDIFVVSNSYCVVAGGPNDGRDEKRTKVKYVSDVMWHDILEFASFADCDAYVFPYLRITEVVFNTDPTGISDFDVEFDSQVLPNPTSNAINIKIDNPEKQNLTYTITDISGKLIHQETLGSAQTIQQTYDVSNLAEGMYYISLLNGKKKVTHPIAVTR